MQSKLTTTKSGVQVGVFATKAHQAKELDFALDIASAPSNSTKTSTRRHIHSHTLAMAHLTSQPVPWKTGAWSRIVKPTYC